MIRNGLFTGTPKRNHLDVPGVVKVVKLILQIIACDAFDVFPQLFHHLRLYCNLPELIVPIDVLDVKLFHLDRPFDLVHARLSLWWHVERCLP